MEMSFAAVVNIISMSDHHSRRTFQNAKCSAFGSDFSSVSHVKEGSTLFKLAGMIFLYQKKLKPHSIHAWCIYQHLVIFYGKCLNVGNIVTWILWELECHDI